MSINFIFRSPVFPIIFDSGKGHVCVKSPLDLERYLIQNCSSDTTHRQIIDSRYEGFSVNPAKLYVSPLTLKKNYSKKELLDLCGVSGSILNRNQLDRHSKEDIFRLIMNLSEKKCQQDDGANDPQRG